MSLMSVRLGLKDAADYQLAAAAAGTICQISDPHGSITIVNFKTKLKVAVVVVVVRPF